MKTFQNDIPRPIETTGSFPSDSLYPTQIHEFFNPKFADSVREQLYSTFYLISDALRISKKAANKRVSSEAQGILLTISEIAENLQLDIGRLPPLHAFQVDGASLLIEWIFPDLRLGISIEPEMQDSGWYIVTTPKLGNVEASGSLVAQDTRRLLTSMVRFVVDNA